MVIDKNYFLARLANGEDIDRIGEDIADMMNAAVAEHEAIKEAEAAKAAEKAAAAEKAQAKRDMALDLIGFIQDYGRLAAPDAADILDDIDDDDVDAMVTTLDQMFQMMTVMAQLKANLDNGKFNFNLDKTPTKSHITPAAKPTKSDDEVLSDFITSLLS